MNWLDYAIIVIIGFGVLHGLAHGALRMLTSILSFVLAIYAASAWHAQAAAAAQYHLATSPNTSVIIGYVAVFVLVFVAVQITGQRIIALVSLVHLNPLDRLGGAVMGAALATIFVGLDIVLLTAILPPNYPLLQDSQLAPEIAAYNQKLLGYVPPQLKQLYEEKRDSLVQYWNEQHKSPAAKRDSRR
jgi:membrane protein required for colicin V production